MVQKDRTVAPIPPAIPGLVVTVEQAEVQRISKTEAVVVSEPRRKMRLVLTLTKPLVPAAEVQPVVPARVAAFIWRETV